MKAVDQDDAKCYALEIRTRLKQEIKGNNGYCSTEATHDERGCTKGR